MPAYLGAQGWVALRLGLRTTSVDNGHFAPLLTLCMADGGTLLPHPADTLSPDVATEPKQYLLLTATIEPEEPREAPAEIVADGLGVPPRPSDPASGD